MRVQRRVRFSAGRRLSSGALDEHENALLFGVDGRLHGREFTLTVTLGGEVPRATGMIMDLKALSRLIKREIVQPLDRTLLNDSAMLGGLPPTTENLAVAIWRRIEAKLTAGSLVEIELAEGPDRTVAYRGE